jgi:sortase (surface protein transpeptidase)
VRVPSAGIDADITAVAPDGSGGLAAPADPTTAGWFAGGPAPGSVGPAVLAGHVDWAGSSAVFGALDTLVAGDDIEVERADGTAVRFTVTRVVQAPKNAFPTAAVYGPTPEAQLRLITCGGVFDRAAGSYEDNVIVFARMR